MKLILGFLIGAAGLWLASAIVPGFTIVGTGSLLLAALLLGIANAIVRPILIILTLPLTIVTLGLFLFVVNLGHIFVFGWPLGFPLPPDPARYWPFIGAIAQVGFSVVLAVLAFLARPGLNAPPS